MQRLAADFAALYCVSIAKRLAGKTNKLLQGLIRDGAPRAPNRHVCDAPLCGSMSLRAHFTFLPCEAKTFHFCAVGISHVFVYDDNYAGQTSIRVHRRAMDLRADLDKGDADNTLAVLSRRICAKACVKTRHPACTQSVCPAEKIHIRSKGAQVRLSLVVPLRRT